jgi:hypothetical protein
MIRIILTVITAFVLIAPHENNPVPPLFGGHTRGGGYCPAKVV